MGKTFRKGHYNSEKHRDKKHWYKPNADFKRMQKKSRKAKERDAMRHLDENEIIPDFPKTDTWDWN